MNHNVAAAGRPIESVRMETALNSINTPVDTRLYADSLFLQKLKNFKLFTYLLRYLQD